MVTTDHMTLHVLFFRRKTRMTECRGGTLCELLGKSAPCILVFEILLMNKLCLIRT